MIEDIHQGYSLKRLEPDPELLKIVARLIEQNGLILKTNCSVLESLSSPMIVMSPEHEGGQE